MLKSLQCQFDSIIATILDPQFKDKFFTKAETKQSARNFLIDNCKFSEHASTLSSTVDLSDDSVEPPRKKARPDGTTATDTNTTEDDEIDDTSSAPSSSKMWECFTELLEEVGVTSDTGGGVETMVDRW